MQFPNPKILIGLEETATARRDTAMAAVKAAVESGDRQQLQEAIQKARAEGVIITPTSVKRLIREKALADAGIER